MIYSVIPSNLCNNTYIRLMETTSTKGTHLPVGHSDSMPIFPSTYHHSMLLLFWLSWNIRIIIETQTANGETTHLETASVGPRRYLSTSDPSSTALFLQVPAMCHRPRVHLEINSAFCMKSRPIEFFVETLLSLMQLGYKWPQQLCYCPEILVQSIIEQ